jgi:hypothetical protein
LRSSQTRNGSVLIEAIVVIGVLTCGLGGSWYAYRVYSTKLDTLYAARQAAWVETDSGCRSVGDTIMELAKRVLDRETHVIQGLLRGELWFSTWWQDEQRIADVLSGEQLHVVTKPATVTGYGQKLSLGSSTARGCNVQPHDLGTRRTPFQWLTELLL